MMINRIVSLTPLPTYFPGWDRGVREHVTGGQGEERRGGTKGGSLRNKNNGARFLRKRKLSV